MTAVVPVYRCGAAPDSHRVPSFRSGWPEHQREVNVIEAAGRVKPAGAVHHGSNRSPMGFCPRWRRLG